MTVTETLVSEDQLEAELAEYRRELEHIMDLPIAEAYQKISGISARVATIRWALVKGEERRRGANPLRTQNVDPLLAECRFQFEVVSRLQTHREFEYKVEKGSV